MKIFPIHLDLDSDMIGLSSIRHGEECMKSLV